MFVTTLSAMIALWPPPGQNPPLPPGGPYAQDWYTPTQMAMNQEGGTIRQVTSEQLWEIAFIIADTDLWFNGNPPPNNTVEWGNHNVSCSVALPMTSGSLLQTPPAANPVVAYLNDSTTKFTFKIRAKSVTAVEERTEIFTATDLFGFGPPAQNTVLDPSPPAIGITVVISPKPD